LKEGSISQVEGEGYTARRRREAYRMLEERGIPYGEERIYRMGWKRVDRIFNERGFTVHQGSFRG